MGPFISDNEDKMLALLKQIEQNTSDEDPDVQIEQNIGPGANRDQGPEIFTTGTDRYLLSDEDGFEKLEFGFLADIVNIRTTDDIVLAVTNQGRQNGGEMKIRAAESPFTIGGDAGLDASQMWVKKADSAASDPGIEVIAFK